MEFTICGPEEVGNCNITREASERVTLSALICPPQNYLSIQATAPQPPRYQTLAAGPVTGCFFWLPLCFQEIVGAVWLN
jgi:hypothetical protein